MTSIFQPDDNPDLVRCTNCGSNDIVFDACVIQVKDGTYELESIDEPIACNNCGMTPDSDGVRFVTKNGEEST